MEHLKLFWQRCNIVRFWVGAQTRGS
jgi:hypothetical protein